LMLHILDVSEHSAFYGKGIEVVGAKDAMAIADSTDGQLIMVAGGQPFPEKDAVTDHRHPSSLLQYRLS
jgi:hypothetical protein